MGCLFSKPTNRVVILRNSFSGLFWMQFTGSLVFLLLGLCPCVGVISREKVHGRYICWDLACLEKKISFHPHTFTFGHKANLGKNICQSESSGCFSNVFKLPVLLPTNLKPVWFTILCAPPPRCSEISQRCVFLVWIFFTYCAEYMKTTFNLETNILQYCKFKIFLLSVFSI